MRGCHCAVGKVTVVCLTDTWGIHVEYELIVSFSCFYFAFFSTCTIFAFKIKRQMSRIYPILYFIGRKKYLIVSVLGVVIIGFVGENSILKHVQNRMLVREMQAEIDAYNMQYEQDEHTLKELQRNPKAITKIARERYFMKAEDEDIFVLSDDRKTETSGNETTD